MPHARVLEDQQQAGPLGYARLRGAAAIPRVSLRVAHGWIF
jgi:hypothetical protein